jgi:hypothetical protein
VTFRLRLKSLLCYYIEVVTGVVIKVVENESGKGKPESSGGSRSYMLPK